MWVRPCWCGNPSKGLNTHHHQAQLGTIGRGWLRDVCLSHSEASSIALALLHRVVRPHRPTILASLAASSGPARLARALSGFRRRPVCIAMGLNAVVEALSITHDDWSKMEMISNDDKSATRDYKLKRIHCELLGVLGSWAFVVIGCVVWKKCVAFYMLWCGWRSSPCLGARTRRCGCDYTFESW